MRETRAPQCGLRYALLLRLRAVYAYLQSIPPLRNEVPVSKVPPEAQKMLEGVNAKMLLHPPGPH